MLYGLVLIFTLGVLSAHAASVMSAARKENIDYRVYEKKAYESIGSSRKSQVDSALSNARLFGSTPIPEVASWETVELMENLFVKARDTKWLESAGSPSRRIFWMYPDDGCFARAGLMNKYFFQSKAPIPNKIFAFGNLSVNSSFSTRGRVAWWYHTAPIIKVGGQNYVLDPSVEIGRPLVLEEWLRRMGDPAQIKIAICSSGTYLPKDDCSAVSDGTESQASNTRGYYLSKEAKRVKDLNLNATEVLGDNPPWH